MEQANTKKKLQWWNQHFLSHAQFLKIPAFVFPTFAKTVSVAAIKHCIFAEQIQRRKLHQMRPKYRKLLITQVTQVDHPCKVLLHGSIGIVTSRHVL